MKEQSKNRFILCRAVLILWSWISVIASVKIIEGPHSVTNASIGGTVDFKCIAEGAASPPIWNINGKDYRVTELPLHHEYYLEGYLEITPITLSMNDSIYYCYYKPYVDGVFTKVESGRATIIISPLAQTRGTLNTSTTFSISPIPPRHVNNSTPANILLSFILLVLAVIFAIFVSCSCVCYHKKWKKN